MNKQIECVLAPIIHRGHGVRLWQRGDRAVVDWNHYWEALLERGHITLAPARAKGHRPGCACTICLKKEAHDAA